MALIWQEFNDTKPTRKTLIVQLHITKNPFRFVYTVGEQISKLKNGIARKGVFI